MEFNQIQELGVPHSGGRGGRIVTPSITYSGSGGSSNALEAARKAEEARKAEAARKAEEVRKAEQQRLLDERKQKGIEGRQSTQAPQQFDFQKRLWQLGQANLTPEQKQILDMMLQQGGQNTDFRNIEQQARTGFEQQTIPSLAERFYFNGWWTIIKCIYKRSGSSWSWT